MSTRVIVVACKHQFNAMYKNGTLKAIKSIRPGDPIYLKKLPELKYRQERKEIQRLAKVSADHAKTN